MSRLGRSIVMYIVGLILFVGLPLLGWGITDAQGFIANPARLGYIILLMVVQAFLVAKFPEMGQNRGEGSSTVGRQRFVVFLLQVFPLALIIAAPFMDRRAVLALSTSDIPRYVGLILFALGFIAVNWAEAALGKQFSVQVTLQKDHELITDGLYRYVRNPRYMGIIIFNLGLALIFNSVVGLLLVLGLTLVLLWRIHDEEVFMHQAFGVKWEAYSKQTWHLIPYIY